MFLRTLKASLLVFGLVSTSTSFASHLILSKNLTKEYDLPPGQELIVSNYYPWTVAANCKVRMEKKDDSKIHVRIYQKSVLINGLILKSGDAIKLDVRPNQALDLEIDAHGEVGLKNHSKHLVNLHCTTK